MFPMPKASPHNLPLTPLDTLRSGRVQENGASALEAPFSCDSLRAPGFQPFAFSQLFRNATKRSTSASSIAL